MYSHWFYNFEKEKYLTNAAYSWDVDKDGFDYLTNSVLWNYIAGQKSELTKVILANGAVKAAGPNMSVLLSLNLNDMLNKFDAIMKDNKTGFDLPSIGFNNFVNSAGYYFTNADAALAAVYRVAWQNIAFY